MGLFGFPVSPVTLAGLRPARKEEEVLVGPLRGPTSTSSSLRTSLAVKIYYA